jgi:hypothetical protein
METPDFGQALSLFSGSQDEFDLWFKRRLADSTGLDLNTPPSGPLPELLSSYSASPQPSAQASNESQRRHLGGNCRAVAAASGAAFRPPAWSS